jgi:DUF4097 and DUF4098 domain-containing protein YvlB
MTLSKLTTAALLITLSLSTSGCIIHVGGHDNNDSDKSDYSSVFGGVDVSENNQVGDISSVNGNINIEDGASADDVDAVNGNIEIGKNVTVHDLSTVNGDIQALSGLSAKQDVSTVNGNISLGKKSKVDGDVATVNGDIHLIQTKIEENITTKNGSITLLQGSVVEGDIEFESQDDSSWWGDKAREYNPPTLTIDGASDVKGKIILRQVVVLEIENPDLLAKVERRYKEQE